MGKQIQKHILTQEYSKKNRKISFYLIFFEDNQVEFHKIFLIL